jgi:exodeoxyribonuclease VII small subunit
VTDAGEPAVPDEQRSFEDLRDELEAIVRRLEDGRTSLDEAIALWERGERLHALCRAKLDGAERRVEELLGRAAEPAPPDGQ